MRQHYTPKPDREDRASAALDFLAALAIGLTLAMLALAYFDVLWP
jgi:fatty acid desaturase